MTDYKRTAEILVLFLSKPFQAGANADQIESTDVFITLKLKIAHSSIF